MQQRRTDRHLAYAAIALIATVGTPYGIGLLWDRKLGLRSAVPGPPDLRALPWGSQLVPEWVFGALLLLGLLGLTLLRPSWRGRATQVVAGLALIAASVAAPFAADQTLTAFAKAGQNAYKTGPIPVADAGGSCLSYWTTQSPVANGAYLRWVMSDPVGTGCGVLSAYQGWRNIWRITYGGDVWYASLHVYGTTMAVAEKDTEGKPNVLVGYAAETGKLLWTFACQRRDDRYLTVASYNSDNIVVNCPRGQVDVNWQNGKVK